MEFFTVVWKFLKKKYPRTEDLFAIEYLRKIHLNFIKEIKACIQKVNLGILEQHFRNCGPILNSLTTIQSMKIAFCTIRSEPEQV